MPDNFFDYLQEKINDDIKINSSGVMYNGFSKIEIIETGNESREVTTQSKKLKKLILEADSNKYDFFIFTIDENNVEEHLEKGLFPYFRDRCLCSSSDAILLVQKKGDLENIYIFYIELKSGIVNYEQILKKHIFSKHITKHILDLLYFKSIVGSDDTPGKDRGFPIKIHEGMIVFTTTLNTQEQKTGEKPLINFIEYNTRFRGSHLNELRYYKLGVKVDNNGESTGKKILIDNFIKSRNLNTVEIKNCDFICLEP
ncbi:hypothetical protein [Fusobacterium ulcerans]